MNSNDRENKSFLFKYEILRARLETRNFFLKNTVREVYENIGQVLSLVRLQLALIDGTDKEDRNVDEDRNINIASSGKLVGQSIKDLRALCKSFYPDVDILKGQDFVSEFEDIAGILFPEAKAVITVKGKIKIIQPELRLVVANMLREMIILVKEAEGKLIKMEIKYAKEKAEFVISYLGNEIRTEKEAMGEEKDPELTLAERIALINAELTTITVRPGVTQIKLTSPLKLTTNE
jgi:nitrate/nitrite-specific signal transduction histidine kinase